MEWLKKLFGKKDVSEEAKNEAPVEEAQPEAEEAVKEAPEVETEEENRE
jgi:hypothetical protein